MGGRAHIISRTVIQFPLKHTHNPLTLPSIPIRRYTLPKLAFYSSSESTALPAFLAAATFLGSTAAVSAMKK